MADISGQVVVNGVIGDSVLHAVRIACTFPDCSQGSTAIGRCIISINNNDAGIWRFLF